MAGISGYDSNSISTLFSSLPTYQAKTGTSNFLGINLSDYSCIKSGAYYKLVKAYYASDDVKDSLKKGIATSEDSAETLSAVKSASSELVDTSNEIYKDSSLFQDSDKLFDKVKMFVEDYNDTVKAAGKSETSSIASAGANLINYTNMNSSMLESVGIKIDSKDYTLSIDEEKFKNASKGNLTSLFKGTGSFAYGVGVKASMMKSNVEREAGKANTYGRTGNYSDTYSAGSMFNSVL